MDEQALVAAAYMHAGLCGSREAGHGVLSTLLGRAAYLLRPRRNGGEHGALVALVVWARYAAALEGVGFTLAERHPVTEQQFHHAVSLPFGAWFASRIEGDRLPNWDDCRDQLHGLASAFFAGWLEDVYSRQEIALLRGALARLPVPA